jgi:hypothetical protein
VGPALRVVRAPARPIPCHSNSNLSSLHRAGSLAEPFEHALTLSLVSPAHVLTATASVRRIINASALASVAVATHWRSHTGNSVLSPINAVARGETGTSRIAWGVAVGCRPQADI